MLPSFAAAGYRAIAVDLAGFGDAADPGYAAHASVLDTMDALDVERAALIGNSFGRAVALRVAVVPAERVAAMALVSAPAPGVDRLPSCRRRGMRRSPRVSAATSKGRSRR